MKKFLLLTLVVSMLSGMNAFAEQPDQVQENDILTDEVVEEISVEDEQEIDAEAEVKDEPETEVDVEVKDEVEVETEPEVEDEVEVETEPEVEDEVEVDSKDKEVKKGKDEKKSEKDAEREAKQNERLDKKEEKLAAINRVRELKNLVKSAKIEALTYLKELRKEFKNIDKENRKEVFAEFAAVKKELKDYSIDTFINGTSLDFSKYDNVLPVIENNRTLVPIRAVTESLGAEVIWDNETNSITITKGDIDVKLFIGEKAAFVNDEEVLLDAAPAIRNNRTLVPMRFIAESFNLTVDWDEESLSIVIE